jgi:pyruvate/2-oxoglutarate dehydrogenase complex dihydrolipoamide dehydrogenase (E3) component
MSDSEHDVIVIGAGPAGEVAAGRLGENGLSVALVESHLVGGECSYYGCMPSKGLLRPAQALAEARRIPGAAEAARGAIDVQSVLDRRDEIVHDLDDSSQLGWLEERNVTLVRGHGRLDGERRVRVGDDVLEARRAVVIAVGTKAAIPPIPGLREADPWTNHEVTTAKAIPDRLLVLGGGVIGAEMAQAYRALGAEVTIVEALPRLLANEEEFASQQVLDAMGELGVEVKLGAKATAVHRADSDGEVTVELETGESVAADELLCAVGRRPMTDDLGVEQVGGEPGKPLEVTDTMQVPGHDWLYVVGDANGRVLLTHMGKYQARLACDHILGRPVELRSDGARSPRITFTEPQVAAVGHTLAKAQEDGLNVRAVDVETSGNAGGSFYGRNAPGTARIVVDEDRRMLVGATITGPEVQDFLHAATIAVIGEVPLDRLWHAVPTFPTRSELWLRLLESYGL